MLLVKKIISRAGIEYVIYELGKFSAPLRILSPGELIRLKMEIREAENDDLELENN